MSELVRTNSIVMAIDYLMGDPRRKLVAKITQAETGLSYFPEYDCFLLGEKEVVDYRQQGSDIIFKTIDGKVYQVSELVNKDA